MHRQNYWTRRKHKLLVYSLQVNSSFKSMSGNTRMELQTQCTVERFNQAL